MVRSSLHGNQIRYDPLTRVYECKILLDSCCSNQMNAKVVSTYPTFRVRKMLGTRPA